MTPIGFSTGAVRPGNLDAALIAIETLHTMAIELSSLREHELKPLLGFVESHDLSKFSYISVHAPKAFSARDERGIVDDLRICVKKKYRIVVHPDSIIDYELWRDFGSSLCIENMDARNSMGRTADELENVFSRLPDASLCFDIAHARHVDPTMVEAAIILTRFRNKISHLHVSDIDCGGKHHLLSIACRFAYDLVWGLVPPGTPLILETPVQDSIAERRQWDLANEWFGPIAKKANGIQQ